MSEFYDSISSPVRAELLLLDSRRKEGLEKRVDCLRKAYDVFAGVLIASQGILEDADLTKTLPEAVFAAGVEFRWIEYPLRYWEKRARFDKLSWVTQKPLTESVWAPIPAEMLTEQYGKFRLTRDFRDYFLGLISGRISYWRAKGLLCETKTATAPKSEISGASKLPRGRKPPEPETAQRVYEIVHRVAGNKHWKLVLEAVCEALDAETVPIPTTWNKRECPIHSWTDAVILERRLAVQAIEYRLKNAKI